MWFTFPFHLTQDRNGSHHFPFVVRTKQLPALFTSYVTSLNLTSKTMNINDSMVQLLTLLLKKQFGFKVLLTLS